jgi:2-polyprenyl-3-methyl-5-hydroxy-6-metoxy-1,4-benzoquinol methylase
MFDTLNAINTRPRPYEFYTTDMLWTDPYISKQMLAYHLDESVDISSRNRALIDRSVQWMIHRFNINANSSVCDFGCGPGLYTSRFAKTGAHVTGIDFSQRSIEYARESAVKQNLDINYIHVDYLKFTTDQRFDLITMIFCDFCVLNPDQRKQLLIKFHEFLKPGGSLILDVFTLNFLNQVEEKRSYEFSEKDGFWSPGLCYVFQNTFKYETESLFLDKYVLYEKDHTREIYNWLQCYTPESLTREFEANGFRIIEQYANVAGDSYQADAAEMAVVAVK